MIEAIVEGVCQLVAVIVELGLRFIAASTCWLLAPLATEFPQFKRPQFKLLDAACLVTQCSISFAIAHQLATYFPSVTRSSVMLFMVYAFFGALAIGWWLVGLSILAGCGIRRPTDRLLVALVIIPSAVVCPFGLLITFIYTVFIIDSSNNLALLLGMGLATALLFACRPLGRWVRNRAEKSIANTYVEATA